MALKAYSRFPLVISTVFTVLFAVGILWSICRFMNLTYDSDLSHRLIEQATIVKFTLVDAETGARGFIITGASEYLDPYRSAKRVIGGELENLQSLTLLKKSENINISNIVTLANTKMTELQKVIDLRDVNKGVEACQQIATTSGKQLMDGVRQLVANIEQQEVRNIEENHNALKPLGIVIIIGMVGLTGCTGAFGFLFSRENDHHHNSDVNV